MTMPSEDSAHDMERLGIQAAPGNWDAAENWVKIVPRPHVRIFEREQHRLLVNEYIDVDGQESSLTVWALLRWQSTEDVEGKALQKYEVMAHGSGFASMREGRHTYFGDDGYVFYLHADLLIWALRVLQQWFDWSACNGLIGDEP